MIMFENDPETYATALNILKEVDSIFDINMSASPDAIDKIANHIDDYFENARDLVSTQDIQIEWMTERIQRLKSSSNDVTDFRVHMMKNQKDEIFKQLGVAVEKIGDLTKKNLDNLRKIDKLEIDVYRLEQVKKALSAKHNDGYRKGYLDALLVAETSVKSYKTIRGALARIRKEIKKL